MKASFILTMFNQSVISLRERFVFIILVFACIFILLLPLKNVSSLGKLNVLLKFFKDSFLFIGVSMVVCFILVKLFLETLITDSSILKLTDCEKIPTPFFKWFFSFWNGYFNYTNEDCKNLSALLNINYIDKALQNVMWIVLILKFIHSIETVLLPFMKNYMSSNVFSIVQIIFYYVYIACFAIYIFISETHVDDKAHLGIKFMYNIGIFYTVLTLQVLIIDKVLIVLSEYKLMGTNLIKHEHVKNQFPVKEVDHSLVPNMKYIISLNLFLIIGVFFKKYYEFKID